MIKQTILTLAIVFALQSVVVAQMHVKQKGATSQQRHARLQKSTTDLMLFCKQSAAEIRKEMTKLSNDPKKKMSKSDRKRALALADAYDDCARSMQREQSNLKKGVRDTQILHGTMSDMTQQLQFELQDAMNKQQQIMQIFSNIMKRQHATLNGIIRNLK